MIAQVKTFLEMTFYSTLLDILQYFFNLRIIT